MLVMSSLKEIIFKEFEIAPNYQQLPTGKARY